MRSIEPCIRFGRTGLLVKRGMEEQIKFLQLYAYRSKRVVEQQLEQVLRERSQRKFLRPIPDVLF